jgi:hypothetical protein
MTAMPQWQRIVLDAQENIGKQARALMDSGEFASGTGLVKAAQREIGKCAEESSRKVLHLLNLPAGSDVHRLLRQIAALQWQVRELTKSVEDIADLSKHADNGDA